MGREDRKREIERNGILCAQCRRDIHDAHNDSGGTCANDNRFDSDCRCTWRPESKEG